MHDLARSGIPKPSPPWPGRDTGNDPHDRTYYIYTVSGNKMLANISRNLENDKFLEAIPLHDQAPAVTSNGLSLINEMLQRVVRFALGSGVCMYLIMHSQCMHYYNFYCTIRFQAHPITSCEYYARVDYSGVHMAWMLPFIRKTCGT